MRTFQEFLYGAPDHIESRPAAWPKTLLLGRVFLSIIFVMSGIGKVMDWSGNAAAMRAEGLMAVPVLLLGAILIEVFGGLALMTGTATRLAALALVVFLIPTTLLFHDFWTYQDQLRQMQMSHFLKNLSIMGGLLVVAAHGPGAMSVDQRLHPQVTRK